MPIKLANVNIMSQLTSRGLDNTSSAFVSDRDIFGPWQGPSASFYFLSVFFFFFFFLPGTIYRNTKV